MKYYIVTFGCQMQKADSKRISVVLERMNYQKALNENEANLVVVNMCSIRQSAVDRVYGIIPKLQKLKDKTLKNNNLKKNNSFKTILTGCILEKDKKIFAKYFDYILDIKDLINWPQKISKSSITSSIFYTSKEKTSYLNIQPNYKNESSVFIPISTGCNNFCTYCVVPYTRGPLVCRDHTSIIKEATNAIKKNNIKEIWLLGQNVNDYQSPLDPTIGFAELLEMINDISGNFWIRFTSPHPKDFSDKEIDTMAKCQKVTPYLNLPAQSGDNEILMRMHRPYTVEKYKNLVKKIRKSFKKYRKGLERDISISTDIIVGFPGETEKQFQNTVKLFKEIGFDMAYIAQYSPRPGTAAEKMNDDIPQYKKQKREKFLTDILKQTSLERNKKFIGQRIKVLINKEKNGFLFGKSRHYKTVKVKGRKDLIGKFVNVRITDITSFGLNSEIIN